MAACSKYMNRFRAALEHRGLPFPNEIINYMGKRATTDRSLDSIILEVLDIIEPPYCQKRHCEYHTSYGFCGCSKKLVPGRCKLNMEYLKRKKEREDKILQARIQQIPDKFLPLSDETKKKIMEMREPDWQKQVKKFSKNIG